MLKDNINQMIRTLAETTQGQPGAGLAEDQPRAVHPHAAGPARSAHGRAPGAVRAGAGRERAARRVLHGEQDDDEDRRCKLFASYAYQERKTRRERVRLGEGLVGQAALEKKRIVRDRRARRLHPASARALGEAPPPQHRGGPDPVRGRGQGRASSWRRSSGSPTSSSRSSSSCSSRSASWSRPSRRRCAPTSCCASRRAWPRSCRRQQEELQQTNEELEEKARQLTEQKAEVERKNREVELAKQELEEKAEQLALTSRYKSQFLANMSHELRTPLNSLLILSRQLADNRDGNLTDKQVEYAEHHPPGGRRPAGADQRDPRSRQDRVGHDGGRRRPGARSATCATTSTAVPPGRRGEGARVRRSSSTPALPPSIEHRRHAAAPGAAQPAVERAQVHRARQVAVDARREPRLERRDERAPDGDRVRGHRHRHRHPEGQAADHLRGVPAGRRRHQPQVRRHRPRPRDQPRDRRPARRRAARARASPARAARSRCTCRSSTRRRRARRAAAVARAPQPPRSRCRRQRCRRGTARPPAVPSEPAGAAAGRRARARGRRRPRRARSRATACCSIVEDDETFARTLLEMARERGFRAWSRTTGAQALELARTLKPDAITLDLRLPDIDGWVVLDRLKHDPRTRHIPVHVISALDERAPRPRARRARLPAEAGRPGGAAARRSASMRELPRAAGQAACSWSRTTPIQRKAIVELIGNGDVMTTAVGSGEEALAAARRASPSTAWCSTCGCPACRASS